MASPKKFVKKAPAKKAVPVKKLADGGPVRQHHTLATGGSIPEGSSLKRW